MSSNLENALKFIQKNPTDTGLRKRARATLIASAIVFWSGIAVFILAISAVKAGSPHWLTVPESALAIKAPVLALATVFGLAVMYLGLFGVFKAQDYLPLSDDFLEEALDIVAQSKGALAIRDAVGRSSRQVCLKDFKAMKVESVLEANVEKDLRAVALRALVNTGTRSH